LQISVLKSFSNTKKMFTHTSCCRLYYVKLWWFFNQSFSYFLWRAFIKRKKAFGLDIHKEINLLGEVFFRTETELNIRNEIERKMQDFQPNVEKEKWLSVWGFKLASSEAQLFESMSALATTISMRLENLYTTYLNIFK
jgi:hypothetical protein